VDPFAILGLRRAWRVDQTEADGRYRELARKVHPDRFAKAPAVQRRMSLQWTAALNEARRVLKDDVSRARWLATGQSASTEKGPRLDPAFLAEMFEWREADEARPGAMAELAAAREQALWAEIEAIFAAWQAGDGDLSLVDDRLARLKYVTGMRSEHGEHRR
jgi:molecular chaperone HscB